MRPNTSLTRAIDGVLIDLNERLGTAVTDVPHFVVTIWPPTGLWDSRGVVGGGYLE